MKTNRFTTVIALAMLCVSSVGISQPNQWNAKGTGGGGAGYAPSFNPHNSNELYLNCDMSEVFHSSNLGASWTTIDFRQLQSNIPQAPVQFSADSMTLYTACQGSLKKSIDKGVTWKGLLSPTGSNTYSLFADPIHKGIFVLSNFNSVYISRDGGVTFNSILTFGGSGPHQGCYVAGAFFDTANIYIGTRAGLLYSSDTGKTFSIAALGGIPAGEAMISFAGAKQAGTTRFFCVTFDTNHVYPGILIVNAYQFYKNVYSIDWGQPNWSVKNTGIPTAPTKYYATLIAMATNDINTAYLAIHIGFAWQLWPAVYKTSNAGGNWSNVLLINNNQNIYTGWMGTGGDNPVSSSTIIGLAVAPSNSNVLLFSDYGFAHTSIDGGVTWYQKYLNAADQNPKGSNTPIDRNYHSVGLENTASYWVSWVDSLHMLAAYDDITMQRTLDAGVSWSFNYSGVRYTGNIAHINQIIKHPVNGNMYAGVGSGQSIYQSYTLSDNSVDNEVGAVEFSADKGQTWQKMHDFGYFVPGICFDPKRPDTMYAAVADYAGGKGGIWVTYDVHDGNASVWKQLTSPPRTEGHPFTVQVLNDGTIVCSYAARNDASGNFTKSAGVFTSIDGGNTWVDCSDPGMQYWTMDVTIDPHDATQKTWYAGVYSGWGGPASGLGGLYKTTNRGGSWKRIYAQDAMSCTLDPKNANNMYIASFANGLVYSSNINNAAPTFTKLAQYPFRDPTRIFFNPYDPSQIWVTSFGNGMKVGTIAVPAVAAGGPTTFCKGSSVTLTASKAALYQWSTGATTQSVVVNNAGNYTVATTDAFGLTDTSAPAVVKVNPLPVVTISTLQDTICMGGNTTLNAAGASNYLWNTSDATASINITPAVTTTYTVTGTDANGCSNVDSLSVSVQVCTGVNTVTDGNKLNIYPNPSNGLFIIQSSVVSGQSVVKIYNLFGEEVFSQFSILHFPFSIDLSNSPAGVYFVKIVSGKEVYTQKVMIAK